MAYDQNVFSAHLDMCNLENGKVTLIMEGIIHSPGRYPEPAVASGTVTCDFEFEYSSANCVSLV